MSIEIVFEEEGELDDLPSQTIFDLTDCCRTCLRLECSLTPTNSLDSDSIKFCDKLEACISGMTWPNKCEPSFICGVCIDKLRIAYDFRSLCLESDRVVQLQAKVNEIQDSGNVPTNPLPTLGIEGHYTAIEPECQSFKKEEDEDITIGEVTLNIKSEGIETQFSPDHNPVEAFACCYCDGEFTKTDLLNFHFKIHTGDKFVRCRICNKSYTNDSDIRQHMMRHCGPKYSCKVCDKKFLWASSLKEHIKKPCSKENWQCDICNKSYSTRYQLLRHTKQHTGETFSCKLCNREFPFSTQLSRHMREHTGYQPYKCTHCDKVYKYSTQLQTHIVNEHDGEKLSCSICGKEFTNTNLLRMHKKYHSNRCIIVLSREKPV